MSLPKHVHIHVHVNNTYIVHVHVNITYMYIHTCTYTCILYMYIHIPPYRSGDSGVTFTNINSRIGSGTLHLDPSITVSPENYKTVSHV